MRQNDSGIIPGLILSHYQLITSCSYSRK